MLEPTKQALTSGRIILASGSPRRYEILTKLGLNLEVVPSTYDENLDRQKYNNHGDYVQDLALYKVLEVHERLKSDSVPPSLIIGADTIVTIDDKIFGKPKDHPDAFRMLSCLANREHTVYTGVCLKTPKTEITFHECTKVKFGDISVQQIEAYVKTNEPLDKAGGYGARGGGACLIEKINGDFFTVIGMPVYSTVKKLNEVFSQA